MSFYACGAVCIRDTEAEAKLLTSGKYNGPMLSQVITYSTPEEIVAAGWEVD